MLQRTAQFVEMHMERVVEKHMETRTRRKKELKRNNEELKRLKIGHDSS